MWKTVFKELASEIGGPRVVDWDRVDALIRGLGAGINERYDEEDSLLSYLYPCVRRGKTALALTERFLSNGYDVSANGGFNGAACLHRLCWSFYDHYILPVAQMLLDAGADPSLDFGSYAGGGGVLESIAGKSGYWVNGFCDTANIFEAYYDMVQRYMEGKPYKGIRAFRDSLGQSVEKVGRIMMSGESVSPYCFKEALIFCTKEGALAANSFLEFLINPYLEEEAGGFEDLSEAYSDMIGAQIRSLRFENYLFARLGFSNGKSIVFMKADQSKNSRQILCAVKNAGEYFALKRGMRISRFLFRSGRSFLGSAGACSLDEAFFVIDERLLYLYQREKKSGANSLRVEEVPAHWGEQLTGIMESPEAVISDVKYVDQSLKWFEVKTAEEFLYFCIDDFLGMLFYKSVNRQENPLEEKRHS